MGAKGEKVLENVLPCYTNIIHPVIWIDLI
jgi:hypothetical protein